LYETKDLINFHTAMKSSTLVILAGMSGTGKSKLVELYGNALGLKENQLRIIPVRPSWTDDADLLGYVDLIHNVYRPGDCGLIDTLIEAEQNEDGMYIVCFDEMNLARVEHYFSQFLSALEAEKKILRLYNEELRARLYNHEDYPPTIEIGSNIMFVGTVNLDESTYHFSDKVLDRSNVIKLNVASFQDLLKFNEINSNDDDQRVPHFIHEWTFTDFCSMKNTSQYVELTKRELSFFEVLHKELHEVSKNMGVGPRIIKQIDLYLKNLPNQVEVDRGLAFDLQIVQRILTKLRGPEHQLKSFIGTVDATSGELIDSTFMDILSQFTDISVFEETVEVLIQKAKELRANGYTI
jgi:5-methylcytosine-specific restriction endonuclease McrBC GTP-binding regulatory subunit McrB